MEKSFSIPMSRRSFIKLTWLGGCWNRYRKEHVVSRIFFKGNALHSSFQRYPHGKRRSGMAELRQFRTGRAEDGWHSCETGRKISEVRDCCCSNRLGARKGVNEHASDQETYCYACGKPDDWKHRLDAVIRCGITCGNRADFRESEGEQFQVLEQGGEEEDIHQLLRKKIKVRNISHLYC